MRKNTFKAAVVAMMAGTLLQLGAGGGCLNTILQQALVQVVANQIRPLVPNFADLVGGGA